MSEIDENSNGTLSFIKATCQRQILATEGYRDSKMLCRERSKQEKLLLCVMDELIGREI
jgi:hypothetical protein